MTGVTESTTDEVATEVTAPVSDELADALSELSGMLVDRQHLEVLLRRVAELAVAVVPGCSHAGVTLLDGERAVTAASTDPVVRTVDQQQYEVGDGPCLDAVRSGSINRVSESDLVQRWPEFAAHAGALGIRSFLAAPLVAGGERVGALNLYGRDPDAFDSVDDALAVLFCGQASVALANARLYRGAMALNVQLSEAMASRAAIEQAKGVLMCSRGLTPDEAFLELRAQSQDANRKLRDVALEIVASTQTPRS